MKTILAFGNFDLEGGRSWAIRQGLTESGYAVELCRTDARGILGKWRDLQRKWDGLVQKPDAIYVPFLGHWILPLAWRLARTAKIPVVFDAFLSLHDTEVHDRRRISRFHPKAWFLWFTDWLCCRMCNVILLDTQEHKEYFLRRYHVPPEKILVIPVGCRVDLFTASEHAPSRGGDFIVEFHGTFIPLQGIDVILRAAAILQEREEGVRFLILGKGQTYPAMRALAESLRLRNVEFIDPVAIEELPTWIARGDICLGIFGTTAKADRVIPNKAYEALQSGKPLLTANTSAACRVFRDGDNILLSKSGDPEDLAKKIVTLKNDADLRERIAENGRRLAQEKFQPLQIVKPLVDWLNRL